jgi:hypothetical protein
MAMNLARSFFLWNKDNGIRFFIATDSNLSLPQDLKETCVIKIKPGEYGQGFSPKLHLDKLAPAQETLFIDSDCLCAANLEFVFDRFKSWDVSVIGRHETEGELFGDIAARCRAVGVSWTPRFCGGIYYLKKGPVSEKVFSTARELEKRYNELGIQTLRGVANEEPLVGLAMALANQHPIPEDGTIKAEPMFFSGRTQLDVFRGSARLANLRGAPSPYPEWKIPNEARPAVVHFNCAFAEQPPYTTEALRLKKVLHDSWPLFLATAYAWCKCTLPFLLAVRSKQILRPGFHLLFGPRAVKPSARI